VVEGLGQGEGYPWLDVGRLSVRGLGLAMVRNDRGRLGDGEGGLRRSTGPVTCLMSQPTSLEVKRARIYLPVVLYEPHEDFESSRGS